MIERLAACWTVAASFEVDLKTVCKWCYRHAAEGEAGLLDSSSRPHRSPSSLAEEAAAEIETFRRQCLPGPAIVRRLGRPVSTVGPFLRRCGLGRLGALEPKPPTIRYQKEQPGELIHIDIKKLGRIDGVGPRITGDRSRPTRGKGWEYLHVCVDDAFRLAHTELLPGERQESAAAFLVRALAWFASLGVTVQGVTTENGSAFRSRAFRKACGEARLKHRRTRPCMPWTNGKAERSIQSSLRERACLIPGLKSSDPCLTARSRQGRSAPAVKTSHGRYQSLASSAERGAAMRPWLHDSTARGTILQ
jgi:hypothetical protein